MGVNEFVVNNAINRNFYKIDKILDSLWSDAKSVVSGNEPDKYEKAKEMILDGGAEIMSYLGEVAKKIDELSEKDEEIS